MLPVMATLKQKILTEQATRELLKRNGMPEPDGVEYGFTCVRFFFEDPKVVLVVDIDEPPADSDSPASDGIHTVGLNEMLGQDDTLEFDMVEDSADPGWLELKRDHGDGDPN